MYSKALTIAAIAGLAAASPAPAAVTSAVAPQETAPAGCVPDYDGTFYISITNVSNSKRDTPLVTTLKGGVLTDSLGRTGYIASNNQYQYDAPPQAGAIYTAGFSVCPNGTLALGNSAIFYACLSGTFYNLYDESEGAQCHQAFINVSPASTSGNQTAAAQQADGQVTGAPVASVACQIGDGQIQGNTCTAPVVTQIHDGQIQANTGAPGVVTQIHDGQIQAPTAVPTNVVTQIHDGQIQAPTAPANAVTQIHDGQIQAPTNASVASATPVPFTGAASSISVGIFSVVAGIIAVLAL